MAEPDPTRYASGGTPQYSRLLEPLKKPFPNTPLIILAAPEHIREAVGAVKAGADDYLTYPVDPSEVALVVKNLHEQQKIHNELIYLREGFWRSDSRDLTQTRSPLFREVLEKVRSVAPTKTTVLLAGETGTGKSALARLIHLHSTRAAGPFIPVHCGALPDSLVESELFGHEKGSFTGAVRRKLGKFQIADGGTILLDEVATISQAVQIKLLQVLQERSFSRVGGESEIKVDVRILAASNQDLGRLVEQGQFRADLYYRLNVFPVELPPLRRRAEDVPLLIQIFLDKLNREHGKGIRGADPRVMEALTGYGWPGNIRELENLLERAYILEKTNLLTPAGFPADLFNTCAPAALPATDQLPSLSNFRQEAVEKAELRYLNLLLGQNQGRIDHSARQAGVTPRQLHNLMNKYGLHKESFKLPN